MTGTRRRRRKGKEGSDSPRRGQRVRRPGCCDACPETPIIERLREHGPGLDELGRANAKKRRRLLDEASPCFLEAVRTCLVNFLKGRVPLDGERSKRLKRHVGSLVAAVRPVTGRRFRKRLQQTGGFLPLLLPAIVSLIGGLAGEAIGRRVASGGRNE